MMKPAEPTTLRTEAERCKWSEVIAEAFLPLVRSLEEDKFKSRKDADLLSLRKPLTTSGSGRVPNVVTV